jgi:hypothetical protein
MNYRRNQTRSAAFRCNCGYSCGMTKSEQVAFRLDTALAKRLHAFTLAKAREMGAIRFTRADAIRILLDQGLANAGFGAKTEAKRR